MKPWMQIKGGNNLNTFWKLSAGATRGSNTLWFPLKVENVFIPTDIRRCSVYVYTLKDSCFECNSLHVKLFSSLIHLCVCFPFSHHCCWCRSETCYSSFLSYCPNSFLFLDVASITRFLSLSLSHPLLFCSWFPLTHSCKATLSKICCKEEARISALWNHSSCDTHCCYFHLIERWTSSEQDAGCWISRLNWFVFFSPLERKWIIDVFCSFFVNVENPVLSGLTAAQEGYLTYPSFSCSTSS